MRMHFNLLYSRATQLVVAVLLVVSLTSSHPKAHIWNYANEAAVQCVLDVDGTQLAQEAKDLLAETFQISAAQVTAVYCCQLIDGRYKYNCTIPVNNSGYVYFTISGGQIIEDDLEGF
ncbi:MAG: hypothetical protein SH808_04200 [Saprospiraceae bacterium]|nr:hypothetical protein [Saprospiraceae bacterium]